jgi:hypothetical protein
MTKANLIQTVLIDDESYGMWSIPDKKFEPLNGECDHWWIYLGEPYVKGMVCPDLEDKDWEPYHVSLKRLVWTYNIKQTNSTKIKYGNIQFRNHINVEMFCNGRLFYEFGTFDMAFALAKIEYMKIVLLEHPFNFFKPEEMEGRKIYWYGLPAIVHPKLSSRPWEICVEPDYTAGLSKDEWIEEYKRRNSFIPSKNDEDDDSYDEDCMRELIENDSINWGDAFSDGHINWFRD